jgi:hypothetical protein
MATTKTKARPPAKRKQKQAVNPICGMDAETFA